MKLRKLICILRGHRWGPNRAPGLRSSGGYCVCLRCGDVGYVV